MIAGPRKQPRGKRARAIATRRRRRGMALILVLAALTVLTVMLSEIQDESSAEFGSALSARDALVAEYAAKSAVNLSRLLIAAEPTIRRSLTLVFALVGGPRQVPVWAYADRILGAFNDLDGADSFASLAGVDPKLGKNLGFKGGGFRLEIVDEDSKINFNVAARGDVDQFQRSRPWRRFQPDALGIADHRADRRTAIFAAVRRPRRRRIVL